MIDIANIVIDTISKAVWIEYPKADVSADYDPTPSVFPCVFIYEASNIAYPRSFDDALEDNHVTVMYVVDCFALDLETARKLRDICDATMQDMKFTRNYSAPTFNIDRTIKRYTSRYTAVVGKPIQEGDTKIYQIYRS